MDLFWIGYGSWYLVAFYDVLVGLFLLGSIVNWPTIVTLLMLPLLLATYYRLAKKEEADALAQFGDAYRHYQAQSAMFWPRLRR